VLLSPGEGTEDELKERQAKGMADPDVQNILMDPIMRQVRALTPAAAAAAKAKAKAKASASKVVQHVVAYVFSTARAGFLECCAYKCDRRCICALHRLACCKGLFRQILNI
jgi:hypothetical protein